MEPEGTERGCSWPFVSFLGKKKSCLSPSRILGLASQITTNDNLFRMPRPRHNSVLVRHKCPPPPAAVIVSISTNSTKNKTLFVPVRSGLSVLLRKKRGPIMFFLFLCTSKYYTINIHFAFCFRSCIILVRTPPLGTKGGWREGRDPPGLLRRQPHASIRKLESTPTPTGDVKILTPAGHTKKDSNTCKGNNPYAYLCTDTYKN